MHETALYPPFNLCVCSEWRTAVAPSSCPSISRGTPSTGCSTASRCWWEEEWCITAKPKMPWTTSVRSVWKHTLTWTDPHILILMCVCVCVCQDTPVNLITTLLISSWMSSMETPPPSLSTSYTTKRVQQFPFSMIVFLQYKGHFAASFSQESPLLT